MDERTPPDEENGEPTGDSPEATQETEEPAGDSRKRTQEHGEPAAPSMGAKTKIADYVPPAERLEGKEQSDTDAMGRDKRRGVIGEAVGPSRLRVIMTFVVFFAIVGVVFVGLLFLVNQVDQPPDTVTAEAPWSAPDVEQEPSTPLQ